MDPSEYKIMDIKYSDEDMARVTEYNKRFAKIALDMVKYNRSKIIDDPSYADSPVSKKIDHIYSHPDFKEFCTTYPVVSKFIVAYGLFSTKAFFKYLDWKAKLRPSDMMRGKLAGNQREQEKFKNKYIYAVYVKYLYKEKGSHVSERQLGELYTQTVSDLNKETDEFFDHFESSKQEIEEKSKSNLEERKRDLINLLKKKMSAE
jgi:hypothetical protein